MNKQQTITKIKEIISEYGGFSPMEIDRDAPVLNHIGKNHYLLIEYFGADSCTVTEYVHETETGQSYVFYDVLKASILNEILKMAKEFCKTAYQE